MIASMMEIAPRLNELLQQVPIDLTLWEANDEDLEPNSPLCLMYGLLDDLPGFGSAYVSKLMAAKRPQLVPIRDKAVSELLGNPVAWWSNWRAVLVQGQLRRVLVEIRSACGLPHISLLRIADAALWEYSQRDH
jgi:hypothetical protein